ncbi:unnamed protein product [Penicillium salamii]|uniref:Xylanolytic transcriptional activator regulatory domain-containing protein n=1 Tax=Penicillium salamii TaxID=1612424 RepID=A0A9W4NM83_9EURO|nr:unnamed protein product [Penicillium salamii]CAG8140401.1 unnamed protein product [Penicillium salamii]CAG8157320.1 unnamed protein product [Penicillium salamii]CAG8159492.1 unnamed protein product [Penicillium salamii]CAG8259316.1 unnamed protein product [Penicillium salamii]
MGTSSSWSFGRRVLEMTHATLTGESLLPDVNSQLFDGHVYDLNWDGNKANYEDIFDVSNLPTADFAKYLISSVKFHCGQLFYLFEEATFMERLEIFYRNPAKEAQISPLWFCHFLLILAFGKMFVIQSSRKHGPSGIEHFLQAMQCMPDFNFFKADPIEKIQVMCCGALYLHSTHNRLPAYRMIGTALRMALENGMYTEMRSSCLDEDHVQRCNLVWWTVYILERRMTSLLGLPIGISEESITAPYPSIPTRAQSSNVMEMQVILCQILAKVDATVYGTEGKLDSRYLSATQSVLRDIAKVTQRLNNSFDLYTNGSMSGTSRISAHLHILEHQCIILTTRPLLYIFLQSKLGQSDPALMVWLKSETVKTLLHICVESAQQILRILSSLLEQGILGMSTDRSTTSELFVLTYEEHFLPFDMDAASTSTISLLVAAAIDSSLLQDHSPWSQRAHKIFDQMVQRGNHAAKLVQSELKQLDGELAQLAMKEGVETVLTREPYSQSTGLGQFVEAVPLVTGSEQSPLDVELDEGFGQHYELSPNQMMDLANSLDLNSLSWPLSSIHDMSGLGM